jgi:hypothetical protein
MGAGGSVFDDLIGVLIARAPIYRATFRAGAVIRALIAADALIRAVTDVLAKGVRVRVFISGRAVLVAPARAVADIAFLLARAKRTQKGKPEAKKKCELFQEVLSFPINFFYFNIKLRICKVGEKRARETPPCRRF